MTKDKTWLSVIRPPSSVVKRETGLEPATSTLEGWHSAIELLPRDPVGAGGLEPPTSASRTLRATNCATPRCAFALYTDSPILQNARRVVVDTLLNLTRILDGGE